MKAIILTRVSTKMQEEGLSLLAQNNRLHEYAERKGLEIIKSFEIVESSTRGERKQFMEMINFCKKQRETIAIVADTVDRVQRSFKESVLLDELMRQNKISYKLRFPFNEFANLTTPKRNRPTPYEPTPSLISLGVRANNNQNVQSGYMNFCEPQFTDKNQGVTLKNATPLQSGWGGRIRTYECRHQKPMPYHLATPH